MKALRVCILRRSLIEVNERNGKTEIEDDVVVDEQLILGMSIS